MKQQLMANMVQGIDRRRKESCYQFAFQDG